MPQTLDAHLIARAAAAPTQELFIFLDKEAEPAETMTFGQLHEQASRLAHRLTSLGAGRQAVLVAAGPGSEHPVALFACFLAGATAVPVYPPEGATRQATLATLVNVAQACAARIIMATRAVEDEVRETLQQRLGDQAPAWLDLDLRHAPVHDPLALSGSQPDQSALLLFTSGSTGSPKGTIHTHRGLLTNLLALGEACGRGKEDVVCSWMPQSHIAGMFFRLLPIVFGARGVMLPVQGFATNPTHWLRAISRYGATTTVAPDFAYAITARIWTEAARTRPELQGLFDLTSLTMAISGGEMVRTGTMAAFSEAFASCGFDPAAFHPYYGLTETLCTSIFQQSRQALLELPVSRQGILVHEIRLPSDEADRMVLVGNGSPVGDTQALAVDPQTSRPLDADQIGEIWVRGSCVTPGYIGEGVAASSWQGRLVGEPDTAQAFFRTGDLGFIHEGQVFVTGRLKELVIIRGKNHYPLDIEATITQLPAEFGILQCAAFALQNAQDEEALGLAVELEDVKAKPVAVEQAVRAALSTHHGLGIERLFLMPKGALPRTTTQKISRLKCARLAQSDDWADFELQRPGPTTDSTAPASSAAPTIFAGLSGAALEGVVLGQVLAQLARCEGVRLGGDALDQPIVTLGLSSLHLARFGFELRKALAMEIPLTWLFEQAATPRTLAQACARQIESGGAQAGQVMDWQAVVRRITSALPRDLGGMPMSGSRAILLTGATGFLGAWLLQALLAATDRPIRCLVRAASPAQGLDRIAKALAQGPGLPEDFDRRVSVITGDLRQTRLGLSENDFQALAQQVGLIVHNAAEVNFVASYAALEAGNVEPLAPLLALACIGERRRAFHFVSTAAIFNGPGLRQSPLLRADDFPGSPDGVYSGYAQTKWVAEAVLREAARRGLPVHIHRPSLIVGDSQNGRSHADDLSSRFVMGCVQMGHYPDAEIGLNLIAVDQVAHGIAAAVLAPHAPPVMHWSAPEPLPLRHAMQRLARRGHPLQALPLSDWLERLRAGLPSDNALYPLQDFLLDRFAGSDKTLLELLDGLVVRIDISQSAPFTTAAGLDGSADPAALLDATAGWMEKTGHLTAPVSPNLRSST